MRVKHTGRLVAPLVAVMVLMALIPAVAQAQDPCQDPGNLTFNCQFDTFDQIAPYGAVASGWTPFEEFSVQPPAYSSAGETPLAPAQEIFCAWLPFTAGIYQQVESTPGMAYVAAIGWAPYASYDDKGERNSGQFIGRKVGIDPRGGTDPTSPNIVWSPEVWDELGGVFPQLRVSTVAQTGSITVFVRAHNPQSHGNDKVWFDAVTLMIDPSQPTAPATTVPPTSTPTSPPATSTSTPVPPTQTPLATDTPPPTATVTVQPTNTPVPTHTSEPVPIATTAPEVSQTPDEAVAPNVAALPTATPLVTVATPAPAPQRETYDWIPTILVAVAAASFLGAGVLGILLLVLRQS
jgi:hypothetical protein